MRQEFQRVIGAGSLLLFVLLAADFRACAQTNKAPVVSTNVPSPLLTDLERLEAHPLTFGLDQVTALRGVSLLGEPLWKYVASLIYILLAFYAAKVIDFITRVWLSKITAKTQTKLDDLLLGLLRGPIKVVVFVLLLNIGLNIFDWSFGARVYLSKGFILIAAASLTYLVVKVLGLMLQNWKRRHEQEGDRKFNDQLFSVIRISLNTFIIIVAVLVTAQNLNINITAAIASLSIGGLAVGLAAQDTLGNLFGAVAVFVDKPFRVGDQIKLDGAEGTVETVGLRSTRLRNPEGQLVAIPNKTMGNVIITNLTRRAHIKTVLNFSLARSLPAAKVKRALELLEEVYRGHPMTQDVWVSFNQFTASGLNIMVVHWWKGTDHKKYLSGMQEMNLAVKERFDTEQISFS
jgi:MscS family membrane protein